MDPVAVKTTDANIERAGLEGRVESILTDFKLVAWGGDTDRFSTAVRPGYGQLDGRTYS